MSTAFQPNAFQNNAFQVDEEGEAAGPGSITIPGRIVYVKGQDRTITVDGSSRIIKAKTPSRTVQ